MDISSYGILATKVYMLLGHSADSGWLVGFNCISISIGYLMPEPFYTLYIYDLETHIFRLVMVGFYGKLTS